MDIESITRRVEERLRVHEDLLHTQKERYELHKSLLSDEGSTMDITFDVSSSLAGTKPANTSSDGKGSARSQSLYEMARVLEQKKEDARVHALQEEQETMRSKPEISAMAKAVEPNLDLIARFEKAKKDATTKLSKKKDQIEREVETYPFKPEISKHAKEMYVDPVSVTQWLQAKEKKLQKEVKKKEQEELSELKSKPSITPRSEHLAHRKAVVEGFDGLPRHEQILQRDKIAKWRQIEQQMWSEESAAGVPRISQRAANLEREGDIATRLYDDSFAGAERRRAHLETHFARERDDHAFTPTITGRAQLIQREVPVEVHMMEMEKQRQARLHDTSMRLAPTHQPVLNPVSEEIAARLSESSMERILRQKATYVANEEPCPFRPTITERSRELDKWTRASASSSACPSSVQDRIESFRVREESRRERIRSQQKLQQAKELEECTFQPHVSAHHAHGAGVGGKAVRNSVYRRVEQWQRRKEQKRREAVLEAEERALSECTFQPDITGKPNVRSVPSAQTIYGDDGKCWGFSEFVARQEEARRVRKEREEQEDRLWATGEKWKNETTTPQEFRLGVPRAHGVKSLQRPGQQQQRTASAQGRHLSHDEDPKNRKKSSSTMDFSYLHMGTLPESSPLSYMPTNAAPGVFSSRLSSAILSTESNPLLRRALETLTRHEGHVHS